MRPRRTLGTELWRELVENLDTGLVVFNDHGVVIYANDEAGRLLGYAPRDVLDLDRTDFAALVSPTRLDGAAFVDRLARAGYRVIDLIGIAVGINNGYNGDIEDVGFAYGRFFFIDIHHKQQSRQPLHITDTT
mgnify:CR=1 FL=1